MKDSCFEKFGVMIDNSRNAVMNVRTVKKYVDILKKLDADFLMLYTEETYEVNNQPYFGHHRGRFSKAELKELDAYAREQQIELMPCIQTLAHFNALMRWPVYAAMADCGDILCAGDERVYALVDDIFATLAECFTSRTCNIGMDEAEFIGMGRYFKEHGPVNRMDILVDHLKRVAAIADKYGFRLVMWGDMFYKLTGETEDKATFDKELADKIPHNVNLIYWDYYSTEQAHYDSRIENYRKLQDDVWFAGGLWNWTGFTAHNSYSLKTSLAAMKSAIDHKVKNAFVTVWGDNGGESSRFAVLPALYAAKRYSEGVFDMDVIRKGFLDTFGIDFDDFMLAELTDTPSTDDASIYNPEKYLLYNDPLMGNMDSLIRGDEGERYAACAVKLAKMAANGEFGPMFNSCMKLCRALEVKSTLGVRTRELYLKGDKAGLKGIIADYDEAIARIKDFYEAFEAQWMWENKPHGFDVHDIRIGGLLMRMEHAKARILKYAEGAVESIPELEEAVLDPFCSKEHGQNPVCFNSWGMIATCNVL
ncbi:MAG: beta-N-acetylhexosaminidase [Clostridia bacterium]|nr:beta-N-acetylhexosaminidase [Clostridia bacterium]